jgi:hypothetical protein
MSRDIEKTWPEDSKRPPIEYLAAFLDDELSAGDREMVQAWLDRHPEDAALVQAHRDLIRLWRDTAPTMPSEKVWNEVLGRIAAQGLKIDAPAPRSLESRLGRRIRIGILVAAAAAVLILALFPPRKQQRPSGADDSVPELGGELAIVGPKDIDLVSLEEADSRLLVGVDPLVQEPLDLVAMGDVTNVKISADREGFKAQDHTNPGSSGVPMIIAPIRDSETKDSTGK